MAWFPNCGDDDEFPDPEIGIWGDSEQKPARPIISHDPRRRAQAERLRKKRENERRVSSDFNRYMIDLFNSRQSK